MIITDPFEGFYDGQDVEADLKAYMKNLMDYTNGNPIRKNKKLYTKEVIPDGYNISMSSAAFKRYPEALQKNVNAYWREWAIRTRTGHNGLAPYMVPFYHFSKLRGAKGATIFRRSDNELFWLIDACVWGDNEMYQGYYKKGITQIGRRRGGKTTKMMWAFLMMLCNISDMDIIVSSKTEDDAKKTLIQDKIQFMYNHLPLGMKPKAMSSSLTELALGEKGRDAAGNPMIRGRNSKLIARPSKAESLEGSTLKAWGHDEQGKTKNLMALVDQTEPALNDAEGFIREGFMMLTGTAGDMTLFPDAEKIWNAADTYNLVRVFDAGWEGWNTDKYGNEDIEANTRMVLEKRKAIWDAKELTESAKQEKLLINLQQFPLTVEEALQSAGTSKWNKELLNAQKKKINNAGYANMRYKVARREGMVVGYGHIDGNVEVLESPKKGCKYIGGVDAYGLKQKDQGSEGVLVIFKLKNPEVSPSDEADMLRLASKTNNFDTYKDIMLKLGHLPVAMYKDRHYDPTKFAEKAAEVMEWYWQGSGSEACGKVLVEQQPGTILNYLMTHYPHMTAMSPIDPKKGYAEDMFGINMKEYWSTERLSHIGHYIEQYWSRIFFYDMLDHMGVYDETNQDKKFDDVDAFGVVLIQAADPRTKDWNRLMQRPQEARSGSVMGFKRGW